VLDGGLHHEGVSALWDPRRPDATDGAAYPRNTALLSIVVVIEAIRLVGRLFLMSED